MGNSRFYRSFLYLNGKTFRQALNRAFRRRLVGLSAEIAYNAMLALFPAILSILTALGLFEDSLQASVRELARQYQEVIPDIVWGLLRDFANEIAETKSKSLFSISFIGAIWVASGALTTAMNALDQIHHIPFRYRRPFWKAKLIAFLITIGTIGLLLLASFIIIVGDSLVKFSVTLMIKLPVDTTGVDLLLLLWKLLSWPISLSIIIFALIFIYQITQIRSDKINPVAKIKLILIVLGIATSLMIITTSFLIFINQIIAALKLDYSMASFLIQSWNILSLPVSLVIVSLAFAFLYRIGPSRWLEDTPIFPGAMLAAFSWAILSALFRLYVTNFAQYNKVYGAVGAVIVLMIWLQLSALVMLLGDQVNVTIGEIMKREARNQL